MIHFIKYNNPDINGFNLIFNIQENELTITVQNDRLKEDIIIKTTLEPYTRYVLCQHDTNGYPILLNINLYHSLKRKELQKFKDISGASILYVISVCNLNPSDKNIILEPGGKYVNEISVTSDVEITQYETSSQEEWIQKYFEILNDIKDLYALSVNDILYYNNSEINLENMADNDYIEFQVKKYKYITNTLCNSDLDNESISITSTSGILNTSLLNLQNGTDVFRLYPRSYKGKLNIILGDSLNLSEYNITL